MFEQNAWREARNVKPTFWAYAPTTQTSLTSFVAITLQLYLHLASATFSKTRFSAKRMNQTSECLSFALHSKILNNSHALGETMSTFHFFTSLAPSAHLLGQCHMAGRTLFLFDFTPNESFRDLYFQIKWDHTDGEPTGMRCIKASFVSRWIAALGRFTDFTSSQSSGESVETSAEAFDWILLVMISREFRQQQVACGYPLSWICSGFRSLKDQTVRWNWTSWVFSLFL